MKTHRSLGASARAAAITLLATAMSGCVGKLCRQSEAPAHDRAIAARISSLPESTAYETQDSLLREMRETLRRSLMQRQEARRTERATPAVASPVEALLLSGGGQLGAYGAGGLVAWSSTDERPEFDIVTGVSTGALIATFAFLGEEYDDVLQESYTKTSTRDVLEPRFLLSLPFADSLARNDGLRRLIERRITPEMVKRVAEEHHAGRSLWVGVVELKTGLFIPIDLGAIAARGGEDAVRDYRDYVLASTAIPVVFPPVCKDGLAFVDGAARQNIFFAEVAGAIIDANIDARIYALINGTLEPAPRFDINASIIAIGVRSIDLLLAEAQRSAMFRIDTIARDRGWRLFVASIEQGDCRESSSKCTSSLVNQFCPEYMSCLFRAAQRRVEHNTFWTAWR